MKTMFDPVVWKIFFNPGEVVEVRIPKGFGKLFNCKDYLRGTISGYFDNHDDFIKWVQEADKSLKHEGIYFTLQVIDPRLIGRAFNRLKQTQVTTSDNNALAYRWLPIDGDPVRPSGVSSSDTELKESLILRNQVATWLMTEQGFPEPIRAMSGNGGHLLFRLPGLPVNEENKTFIKNLINITADHFDTDRIKIDRTVFNPSRIWKLYGTKTSKGDAIPAGQYREARPHRIAYIENLGNENEND
jgi:hypothetical protein